MAVRTLLRNLYSLDEEALRPVPLPILERLWSTILYNLLDSVRLWQIFATVGGLGVFKSRRLETESNCQYHGLKDSIKWATSTSIHWLTDLTISELNCTVDDLMSISELRNLRNLTIQAGNNDKSHVSDSILREWAYSTKKYGGLSYLQTMFLAGQNVTSWSLQHLEQFPSLDTFCALRCRFGELHEVQKVAKQAGWSLCTRASALRHFINTTFGRLSKSSKGYDLARLASSYAEHRKTTERVPFNDRPHLEVSFGCAGRKSKSASRHFSTTDKDFLCFERDGDQSRDTTRADVDTPKVPTEPPYKPVKRRKLKDGKSIALQHIFFDD